MQRRRLIQSGAVAALAALGVPLAGRARAQAGGWPTRPLRMLVPFGPGSTPDIVARLVGEQIATTLGQPVVVENKAGAGGMVATGQVAKAAPDGYTLGISITGPLVNNTVLYRRMPYDPFKDLAPLTLAAIQPAVLTVAPELGVDSAPALFRLLKARPGRYNYASVGNGTVAHLAMELIKMRTETFAVHIVYPSSPAAVQSMLAGDTQMAALAPAAVIPQVKAGKLKALAVTLPERSPFLPDLPSFREIGLPEVQASAWMGFVTRAGTPQPILDRIHAAMAAALRAPSVVERMHKVQMTPVGNTPAQFAAFMQQELARWRPVIERTGLKLG
jgi:tripartite-type tricarboxylate transporter receptor subunit TctC